MANTGMKGWTTLEEYYLDDNSATGYTKPNIPGDPDYVEPVEDLTFCPPAVTPTPTPDPTATPAPGSVTVNVDPRINVDWDDGGGGNSGSELSGATVLTFTLAGAIVPTNYNFVIADTDTPATDTIEVRKNGVPFASGTGTINWTTSVVQGDTIDIARI